MLFLCVYSFRLKHKHCVWNTQPIVDAIVSNILIHSTEKWKPSKCSLNDLFRSVLIAITSAIREPTTQICGGMIIFDFEGLALNQIMQFTPSFAAMILEWVQVCY